MLRDQPIARFEFSEDTLFPYKEKQKLKKFSTRAQCDAERLIDIIFYSPNCTSDLLVVDEKEVALSVGACALRTEHG